MLITKDMTKISAILGLILGSCALIPYFIFYMLLILFFLSSTLSVIYINKKITYMELDDYKKTAYLGSILGFISFIGFILVFVPCVLVISFIFKSYYSYGLRYLINFQAFWLFLLIIVTVGIICATTNATALMGFQFIQNIRKELKSGKDN